jgi:hypothetical protein
MPVESFRVEYLDGCAHLLICTIVSVSSDVSTHARLEEILILSLKTVNYCEILFDPITSHILINNRLLNIF